MAVGDLVEETGFGQANVSKHLQLLHSLGFVSRRKEGLFVYYALADKQVPIFGICLGHQLLGLTVGASTAKMPYGHRGGNHPVREIETGRILITSQNHGFAVQGTEESIPGAPALEVTHVNLNDGTVEGLRHRELPIFAVQYHPEAAPGPHDGRPLFEQFMETVRKSRC